MIYHVAKNGDDFNDGSKENPFLTIQQAANAAVAGDHIIVHEGTYREWVKPVNGGLSADKRIVYQAAEREKVVIKGSEIIQGWELLEKNVTNGNGGNIWKVTVPNSLFGDFNPFAQAVCGDWLVEPREHPVHLGEIYLNGEAMYEAKTLDELYNCLLYTSESGIIPVDFRQPVEPALEDSCGACVIAGGLIELAKYVPDVEKPIYLRPAVKILKAITETRADWSCNCDAIVQNCSAAYHDSRHHFTMVYADYFYIEAIYKLNNTGILMW